MPKLMHDIEPLDKDLRSVTRVGAAEVTAATTEHVSK